MSTFDQLQISPGPVEIPITRKPEPPRPLREMTPCDLALAIENRNWPELVTELHRRDYEDRRLFSGDRNWHGGRIPSYSDKVLRSLWEQTRWTHYREEIERRAALAAKIHAGGCTFAEAIRDWCKAEAEVDRKTVIRTQIEEEHKAAVARFKEIDNIVRRVLFDGPIVTPGEVWDLDENAEVISRPIRAGDQVAVELPAQAKPRQPEKANHAPWPQDPQAPAAAGVKP